MQSVLEWFLIFVGIIAFLSTCVTILIDDKTDSFKKNITQREGLIMFFAFLSMLAYGLDKWEDIEGNKSLKEMTASQERTIFSQNQTLREQKQELVNVGTKLTKIKQQNDTLNAKLADLSTLVITRETVRAEEINRILNAPSLAKTPPALSEIAILKAIEKNARSLAGQIRELKNYLTKTTGDVQDSLNQKTNVLSGQLSNTDKGIKDKLNKTIKDVIEQLE